MKPGAQPPPSRKKAVLLALLVTFLWSTSWVLIKFGLADIPPVAFAGLRYGLAFLVLLPLALRPRQRQAFKRITRRQWAILAVLGLLYYAVTQGSQFVGLDMLPAITVSLLLNFTSIIVMGLGAVFLAERPTWLQGCGVGLNLVGVLLYFGPVALPQKQILGVVIVALGVLANAASAILGRRINRSGELPALHVTVVSMGIGAFVLLAGGLGVQGIPRLSLANWATIAWLAVVNTALAFTLWNYTLQALSATEASILNSTMLVQIALLAWIFLGERLSGQQIAGMGLTALGALLVQYRPKRLPGILRGFIRKPNP